MQAYRWCFPAAIWPQGNWRWSPSFHGLSPRLSWDQMLWLLVSICLCLVSSSPSLQVPPVLLTPNFPRSPPSLQIPSCPLPLSRYPQVLSLTPDTLRSCPSLQIPSCPLPLSRYPQVFSLSPDTLRSCPSLQIPSGLFLTPDTLMSSPSLQIPSGLLSHTLLIFF